MNKRIKKDWLTALRSGDYKQTKGELHGKKGYCCLGVLYDIEFNGDWIFPQDDDRPSYLNTGAWMIDNEEASLGSDFIHKCRIVPEEESELIDMNDEGATFKEIADWIKVSL